MKFQITVEVSSELELDSWIDIPAYVKRELAHKLIDDLPMEKLEQIITFSCIRYDDPIDQNTPEWERDKIARLNDLKTIEWTAKIDV